LGRKAAVNPRSHCRDNAAIQCVAVRVCVGPFQFFAGAVGA
jgi:hypothetical protein